MQKSLTPRLAPPPPDPWGVETLPSALTSTDKEDVELVDVDLSLPLEDPSDSPTIDSDLVAAFAIKSPSFVSTLKNLLIYRFLSTSDFSWYFRFGYHTKGIQFYWNHEIIMKFLKICSKSLVSRALPVSTSTSGSDIIQKVLDSL